MNPESTPAITFQQKKNDVIKLNQRKNALKIQKSSGMLAQKLTAVVGPTYALSFLFGGFYGLISAKPPLIQRSSFKLKMNYYLNTIGKTSAKFANYSAAALFLYLIIAKSTDYIFKEELEGLNKNTKTAIFGGLTGAVYRVGFPMKAVLFSTVMGSMAACTFNQAWERGFVQIKLV